MHEIRITHRVEPSGNVMEMEMDSHGGLEVTIRQTESKKNYPTTS